MDSYNEFVAGACRALTPNGSTRDAAIIVSNSRVLDIPSEGEVRWSLGSYFSETGGITGKNKMIFGLYVPHDVSEEVIIKF
jgi:hypothetical protein